ncbi:MAG TPA: hypothetical protein VM425_19475 [Myxococcota bacterium]|nr:hypothetical protein [Myxococcota bacterium]
MALLIVLFLSGGGARAADVDLRFTVIGQGYQTRTAAGDFLDRRRLVEWVDLSAGRLLGIEDLSFETSFRLNTELGFGDDLDAMGNDQAELMLARVRWRRLAGRLDLTAGRQLLLDELDFLLFDGLRADLSMPVGLSLKLIAGFEVRGHSLLGGQDLELDGVEDGTLPAPVVGAGLTFNSIGLRAELVYRRMLLWTQGWPLLEERLGASAAIQLWRGRIGLSGGAVFNLLEDHWDRLRASSWIKLPVFLEGVRIEGGYLRSRPRFSLDSIFNFFSPAPFNEYRLGLRWDPRLPGRPPMSYRLGYTRRAYLEALPDEQAEAGTDGGVNGLDFEGRLWADSRLSTSLVGAYEDGAAGRRWLLAPRVMIEIAERRVLLDGRAIIMSFADPLQENQHALTLGCSVAATWRFTRDQAIVVLGQLNGNRINPLRFRLLAVLDLAFHFNPGSIFP